LAYLTEAAGGKTHTIYYGVRIVLKNGAGIGAVDGIARKSDAQYIVDWIMKSSH
jgi:hypothetical protein